MAEIERQSPRTGEPLSPLPNAEWLLTGSVVVVGLGGIGAFFSRLITMYLAALDDLSIRILLVDGDAYEDRNRSRVEIPEYGNKAEVVCGTLQEAFGRPGLAIRPIDAFVDTENVAEIIGERDVVFACVDNHATRKVLSDHVSTLDDILLISAGNDGVEGNLHGTYGNVQVYQRRGGVELHPPLTRFHPEIAEPEDQVPGPSCADLAATTAPQIIFTNFFAAAAMGSTLFSILSARAGGVVPDETCFDIVEARMTPLHFRGERETGTGKE